jgi:hypothetical protein
VVVGVLDQSSDPGPLEPEPLLPEVKSSDPEPLDPEPLDPESLDPEPLDTEGLLDPEPLDPDPLDPDPLDPEWESSVPERPLDPLPEFWLPGPLFGLWPDSPLRDLSWPPPPGPLS